MPTPPETRVRDLLVRAVAAGILSPDQAAAVAALDGEPAGPRRGAVLAEVLGYVGGALAVVAGLFLGAELWGELGPWPRVLLLAAVAAACLVAGGALGGRDGAPGRLGGFLWAAAVVAVAGTVGVGVDGLLRAEPGTPALVAACVALAVAALLWWWRPAVLQHVATFAAAAATLLTALDRLGDGAFDWGGPLLWLLGLAWLAVSALPRRSPRTTPRPAEEVPAPAGAPDAVPVAGSHGDAETAATRGAIAGTARPADPQRTAGRAGQSGVGSTRRSGLWRPVEPGWVLGALAVVAGPLFAQDARGAWLVVGAAGAAALVVAGVRVRRPWVAAVGTGGVFLTVPLAVAELFDARLGPLVGILVVGLALVAAAVVLTRRAAG
jgi:Predicted membrane protein (DUF2157)